MAKLNLDRVKGHYVETIKADKEYENGSLVGKGLLEDGEIVFTKLLKLLLKTAS